MIHEHNYDHPTIPYISLFSGYEGIGIGLKRVFGESLRTIAYCEREAYACANLVDKIEQGRLDAAPIFTDVHTFPWEQYAPFMANGILSFGFPCQPVSCAGKRKVTEDERWLFDVCADGIEKLKPGILFAENVEGLLSARMPNGKPVIAHIFERLEKIHYTVEAGLFSAAECGAPHQRKRVFILANTKRIRGEQSGAEFSKKSYGDYEKWPARPGEPQHEWEEPRVLGNTSKPGLQVRASGQMEESKREKPKLKRSTDGCERQTQPFMGLPTYESASGMDSVIPRMDRINRIDRLRLLGNGVVPATAEKAFVTLMNRISNPTSKHIGIQMELFD